MDAIFLSAVLAEARKGLEGARVLWVAPDGPEALALGVGGPPGKGCLCVGWEAWGPRWYLSRGTEAAPGQSSFAAAARALRGGRIEALIRPGLERAVGLQVERRRGGTGPRHLALWAFLWPGGRNAVLVDAEVGEVVAAARPGAWRPGSPFAAPAADPGSLLVLAARGPEGLEARLRSALDEAWKKGDEDGDPGALTEALARAAPGLGAILAREVIFRAAAGRGAGAGLGPGTVAAALADVMAAVRDGGFAPRVVLGADGRPQALAAVPLRHVPEERQLAYPSPAAAAEAFFAARRAAAELNAERVEADRLLRRAKLRLARRIDKLEGELAEHRQALAYRQMGEILVAHQRGISRGASEARLPDPYGPPGSTRTIPLDPALSIAANVERYFRRARRGSRGEALTAGRLAAARRELDRLQDLEKALADAAAPEAVREICAAAERLRAAARRLAGGGQGPGARGRPQPSPRPPTPGPRPRRAGRAGEVARLARQFVSTDGFPILVGRDNVKNDELTLHVARPDDLWLHVEGYGGSHVVVRREGRAEVPRQTLLEAAQLAAYYSQARGQRKVPVHYTLRKHVRKPKGAKPGLVTITQEKTILATADPALVRRLAAPGPPGD